MSGVSTEGENSMAISQALSKGSARQRSFVQMMLPALVIIGAALSAPVSGRVVAGPGIAQAAQSDEPTVNRNSIDTHLVHFGVMQLRARANGSVLAVGDHPMARVAALREAIPHISIGDKASVRIFIKDVAVPGTVAGIGPAGPGLRIPMEIAISSPLPEGTMVDDDVSVTVEYGRIESTAYMVWGDFMKENSEGVVFKMDPDGNHATRVNVHFGEKAAELIQIKDGLQLGDKVIISNLTKYNRFPRINID